jgi:hypothetical protein
MLKSDVKNLEEYYYQWMNHYKDEVDTQIIVINELADALKLVEWTTAPGGETYCPWCLNLKIEGHKSNCPRQQALSSAGR